MSSRDSPSSQLSEYSSPSSYDSPPHSPKLSANVSWNNNSKSSNRGNGVESRRRGPGFSMRPRPQTVSVGERLCLKCSLLGHPKPTVTWEKDGELVDDVITNGHICTLIDGKDYQLVVEVAGPGDAGKYAVTARNSLGKQTTAVDVIVLDSGSDVSKDRLPRPNGPAIGHQKPVTDGHYTADVITSSGFKKSRDKSTSSVGSFVESFCKTTETRENAKDDLQGRRVLRGRPNRTPPAFLRRLASLQVLEGDELLLQCEVSGDPELLRMVWKRNGAELGNDEDEVFTSFREGVARLRLRDVQSHHAGEYVCEARNETGAAKCSSRVTVKARKIESRPRFIRAPSNVRANEGETLTIEAEIEGIPTPEILWSLDGEEIIGGDATLRHNVARLILRHVTEAHSGQYMCSAMNSSGEDSVACRVRIKRKMVEVAPAFSIHLSDITTDADNDVFLRCVVTGFPEPSIDWMYNEEVITSEDGVGISFQDGVAILNLEQAAQEDSGSYACVAVNGAGRALSRCRVIVSDAEDPVTLPKALAPGFLSTFDEYIRVLEGDSLTLECEILGNPTPEIKWTINEKRVENATTHYENSVARLTISEATSSHGGHIKCSLSSIAGTDSYQARIYVRARRVAPSFDFLLPESIEMFEGEEAYFECKVKGHPQPRVAWSRDGKSLSVLSAETSYENGMASVRIRRAGPRDAGKYVCVARNLSGEAESVCKVRFSEKSSDKPHSTPPHFLLSLEDVVINDGHDLRLECHVTGNPQPEVTWLVEGQKIHPDDGEVGYRNGVATLLLDDVMPEDSGEYKCVAVNPAGEVSSSCHVTVQETPPPTLVKPAQVEPSFPVGLEDYVIKKGGDIRLKCHVMGNPRPEITWLLNGNKVVDTDVKHTDEGETELFVRNASSSHEGKYSCVAENSLKKVVTSCEVRVEAPPPSIPKKKTSSTKTQQKPPSVGESATLQPHQVDARPSFIQPLEDVTVQDGSLNFELSCRVSGKPVARWYHGGEEIKEDEGFRIVTCGDVIKLVFAEVFPDDSGEYSCVISNRGGEERSSCMLTVQEIDGEPPIILMKPKQVTVGAGGRAAFSCRVDGDPPPTVHWMFCNQPVERCDRVRIIDADASNNYTYTLEISNVFAKDAGKYSVCCRNMLGDVTCTISLIVVDGNKQESRKDFRGVLKKVKSPTNKATSEENIDFRGVLRKASFEKDEKRPVDANDGPSVAYKEVLSTSVKTKALTEEERKVQRAEQKDFRSNLTRKVDMKVVNQETLRLKGSEQVDFRDEALKKKVRIKAIGQDELKSMHAEQKDFRAETIKSKVVTKAYREETIKAKKAEQVDFRKVLSPTKREEERFRFDDQGVSIADIPRAKWKKETDHTTVTTRRSRHRNPAADVNKKAKEDATVGEAVQKKPEFTRTLCDATIRDGKPFELVCHVTGEQPMITWFLDDDEIKSETDVTITHQRNVCKLGIIECFPEDQGRYTCRATNRHGRAATSCYVTVIEDDQ